MRKPLPSSQPAAAAAAKLQTGGLSLDSKISLLDSQLERAGERLRKALHNCHPRFILQEKHSISALQARRKDLCEAQANWAKKLRKMDSDDSDSDSQHSSHRANKLKNKLATDDSDSDSQDSPDWPKKLKKLNALVHPTDSSVAWW